MSSTAPAAARTGDRRWLALGLIAAAQFMVIMDTSIIGVALPEMQQDLGFDPQNLSWVFNAYVVAFGGLLLLGGRLSDLLGARRMFSAGWAVIAAGSLVAGLADTATVEIVGRAVQGVGAALIAPSALTLLFTIFGANPRSSPRPSRSTAQPRPPAARPGSSSAASLPSTPVGLGCSSSTCRWRSPSWVTSRQSCRPAPGPEEASTSSEPPR